jgi:hypothetical protein
MAADAASEKMSLDVAMLCFTDLEQILAMPTAHDADGSVLFSQGARNFRVLVDYKMLLAGRLTG